MSEVKEYELDDLANRDTATGDAERFVREFQEWRDAFKPTLTIVQVAEAVEAADPDAFVEVERAGGYQVGGDGYSLCLRDGVVLVWAVRQNPAKVKLAARVIAALEGLVHG